MDGPDHYKEAQRLLDIHPTATSVPADLIARAQVHATLAQIAATMETFGPGSRWAEALA